ncbi:amidohydrolase [Penicillium cosmopolitanum]|uniref:Amidohydrolase n=1 Tax=Penicillium cosmopolitanum TaxID=1131564 RepID=A0A9W9VEU0_9EURO|nr:amidohydrolase [Penicillium cosmopolitanum]KAJ5376870.1 amidohydrolase [Penicillium cosmopolitanum]
MTNNLSVKPWLPQTPPPEVIFFNVNLVDTELGDVIPNSIVKIKDGLIVDVTTGSAESHSLLNGTNAVDLEGQYLCPGLIDCHVHLTATPGALLLKDLFAASPNSIAYRTAFVAREMLLRGFTTARDTGGADSSLREAIREGLIIGPRLFIAGKALSQTGGHGDLRASYEGEEHKCCGGHSPAFARVCDGVPECLSAVRDELRQGANFIKIMCGGGVATPADALDMLQFNAEEIRAITTTARYSKTYVTAHAYTIDAIRHAVDNGVMGIEHGNFIDEETAAYCTKKGVVFTPTLVTYKSMSRPPFDNFLDKFSQEKKSPGLHSLQNEEFSIRSSVLSAKEILQSATVNAAKLLGMENRLGCIKKGGIADILILKSNPLEDITILDRIDESLVAIIKEGRVVFKRSSWLAVDPMYDPCRVQAE